MVGCVTIRTFNLFGQTLLFCIVLVLPFLDQPAWSPRPFLFLFAPFSLPWKEIPGKLVRSNCWRVEPSPCPCPSALDQQRRVNRCMARCLECLSVCVEYFVARTVEGSLLYLSFFFLFLFFLLFFGLTMDALILRLLGINREVLWLFPVFRSDASRA